MPVQSAHHVMRLNGFVPPCSLQLPWPAKRFIVDCFIQCRQLINKLGKERPNLKQNVYTSNVTIEKQYQPIFCIIIHQHCFLVEHLRNKFVGTLDAQPLLQVVIVFTSNGRIERPVLVACFLQYIETALGSVYDWCINQNESDWLWYIAIIHCSKRRNYGLEKQFSRNCRMLLFLKWNIHLNCKVSYSSWHLRTISNAFSRPWTLCRTPKLYEHTHCTQYLVKCFWKKRRKVLMIDLLIITSGPGSSITAKIGYCCGHEVS